MPARPPLVLPVLVLLMAGALAGCAAPSAPAPAPETAAPVAAAANGCDGSLEGALVAVMGAYGYENYAIDRENLRVAWAYANRTNEDGGIDGRCVEILPVDTAGDEEHLLAVAQQVVDAGAIAVVGPTSSDEAAAILPLMEDAGILVVSQSATSVDLAGASPHFFRTVPSDAVQGPSQASWTLTVLKAKTALVLYQDNSYALALKDSFSSAYTRLGGKLAGDAIQYDEGAFETYGSVAQQAIVASPAAIVVEGWSPDSVHMIRALRDAGYTGHVLTSESIEDPSAFEFDGGALDGAYFTKADPDVDNPAYARFVEEYEVGAFTPHTHDAMLVIVQTLQATGADASFAQMREHILSTTFAGTVTADTLEFEESGDIVNGGFGLWKIAGHDFERALG